MIVALSAESFERSSCHFRAAISSSSSRALAAIFRNWLPICGVLRLPKVPMSNGVSAVSPITIVIEFKGARSSSATCCAKDVRMFCPISTFPVKTVILLSGAMCSHESTSWEADSPRNPAPDSCVNAFGAHSPTTRPAPTNLKRSRRLTANPY